MNEPDDDTWLLSEMTHTETLQVMLASMVSMRGHMKAALWKQAGFNWYVLVPSNVLVGLLIFPFMQHWQMYIIIPIYLYNLIRGIIEQRKVERTIRLCDKKCWALLAEIHRRGEEPWTGLF